MAHINLLPWREELRKQKQKEFGITAAVSVLLAGLIVLLAHLHVSGLIDNQQARNAFLENEIEILNERIGRIKELEAMKADLLARMHVIQELQSSRPESVHLMDEMVRSLPEGVYLRTFAQSKRNLTMEGLAQSNARVSDYMRNIDTSEWLGNPQLVQIVTKSQSKRRFADFTLRGSQKVRKRQAPDAGDNTSEDAS
jgi:type IV pilus assembly protein PilN